MTNSNQNNDQNLFTPAVLALLLILIAAGAVWATQLRPAIAPEPAEPVIVNTASTPASTENQAAPAQSTSGDAAAGQQLFTATCAACHGPGGEGVQGLGKALTTSEFTASQSDDQLVDFIKAGRDPGDPLNTTGIGMPPKGGNPALSDDDLDDIVAFIRSIQE
ncbi:MAG TPA: cytochrome c [Anaerolineae bacterium]|jgi:disulfide bond formation protein DsbB